MIAVAFITDRGDRHLPECQVSFNEHVTTSQATFRFTVDDKDHNLGLAGAVQTAWNQALECGAEFLFHVEEDFLFVTDIDLDAMAAILDGNHQLAQLVLKRQPWSAEEHAAGGIIEMHPDDYTDHDGWVEHRRIFSLNPCLIPRHILMRGWPKGNEAEATQQLTGNGFTFGFYGERNDPPRVVHVGAERSAGWRL